MVEKDNIIFIAVNECDLPQNAVFDEKDKIKLLYCNLKDNNAEIIHESMLEHLEVKRNELQRIAAENMRIKFPCNIFKLGEYVKNHEINISVNRTYMDDIYVLACLNEDFTYASSGLYYSADLIKNFSQSQKCNVIILPCTIGETYIIPENILEKTEINELMEGFKNKCETALDAEPLIFSDQKLMKMSDYNINKKQSRIK